MKPLRILSMSLAVATTAACSTESAKPGDTVAAAAETSAVAPAASETTAQPGTRAASAGGMMDPNSASAAELAAIPGVTAEVAAAVVAARPYANMVAVNRVLAKSLNEQQRDSVYTKLWAPIDLNTATGEEILLIPGVGPRMRHEFEEYRPYTSIEQFRREIGKYVDKDEVARLERYVAIR